MGKYSDVAFTEFTIPDVLYFTNGIPHVYRYPTDFYFLFLILEYQLLLVFYLIYLFVYYYYYYDFIIYMYSEESTTGILMNDQLKVQFYFHMGLNSLSDCGFSGE